MNTKTKMLLSVTIGMSMVTNAQNILPYQQSIQSLTTIQTTSANVALPEAAGDTIFVESFGNGFSGDGLNGAWTSNGTVSGTADADAVWEYRGTSTTPNNTIGSRGAYVGTIGPIVSPTQSNGFMIFDSDYLDNAGIIGNFGNGLAATPHKSWLISPSFSTVGINNVSLRFNYFFRRFKGDGYVLLSTNGGTTWSDTITVFDAIDGINSIGLSSASLDLPVGVIANSANVKLAFYFDGSTNGEGYYYYLIDDVVVYETPENDLRLDAFYFEGYQDPFSSSYYHKIPLNQAVNAEINFGGAVKNYGMNAQTNVAMEVEVTKSGTTVWTATTDSVNIASVNSDSVQMNSTNYYSPSSGLGMYNFNFNVVSDSVDFSPDNNMDSSYLEVTNYTYGWDGDSADMGNTYTASSNFEIALRYRINTPDTIRAISVYFKGFSNGLGLPVNSVLSYYLYSDTNLVTPLASHLFYITTANDVDTWLTLPISATAVDTGNYYVGFLVYDDSVYVGSNTASNANVRPLDVIVRVDVSSPFDPWSYVTSFKPYIRLITNDTSLCSAFEQTNTVTVCSGDNFTTADGTIISNLSSDTTIVSTLVAAAPNGCDSIITEEIIILPTYSASVNVSVCTGVTYTFLDGSSMVINSNIVHTNVFAMSTGCDSLIDEVISTITAPSSTVNVHICYGDNYTYADGVTVSNVTTNQNHTSTFSVSNSCDSTITENLMVPFASLVHQACKGTDFTFIDGTVTVDIQSTSSYTSTIVGAGMNGCDSIVEETVYVITVDVSVVQTGPSLMAGLSGASYQWYNCGTNNPISGETNQTFTATANGQYSVLVDDGTCSDMSTCYTVTGLSVGETSLKYGVKVYPNPTEDVLYVDRQQNTALTIEIMDNTGKLVYSKVSDNQVTKIDLSQFSSGIYIVTMSNESGTKVEKIIKN